MLWWWIDLSNEVIIVVGAGGAQRSGLALELHVQLFKSQLIHQGDGEWVGDAVCLAWLDVGRLRLVSHEDRKIEKKLGMQRMLRSFCVLLGIDSHY